MEMGEFRMLGYKPVLLYSVLLMSDFIIVVIVKLKVESGKSANDNNDYYS